MKVINRKMILTYHIRCVPAGPDCHCGFSHRGALAHVSRPILFSRCDAWDSEHGMYLFLGGRIMMHHRNEGHVMTQSQEEMAVIGILALFWVGEWKAACDLPSVWVEFDEFLGTMTVFLVAYKSFRGTTSAGAGTEVATPSTRDPCLQDGVRCVYEEYYYW